MIPPEQTEPTPSASLAEAIRRLTEEMASASASALENDSSNAELAIAELSESGESALPDDVAQGGLTPAAQKQVIPSLTIVIDEERLAKLDAYCRALWALNEQINLTRHTTYDLFVRRDLLDTYQLAAFIPPNEEVLDLGTGGGVPGIPLAILRPDLKVSLCDSVGKKARAIDGLVRQLKLPIPVHAQRAQDVLEDQSFDTVVTRAAGSITQLCNWLQEYWHCFNRLLAIKGPKWVEERGEARHRGVLHGIRLRRVHGYKMPGTKSESVILQMEKPKPFSRQNAAGGTPETPTPTSN